MSSTVKSARRVLEILELFDRVQKPLSLTDIARSLDYPVPSALALLKSLKAMDYVSFDRYERTYVPTVRVAMLGGWMQGQIFLNGAMISLMNELAEQSGETIMLSMQNNIYAQYVHTVQSGLALRYYMKPGGLRPMCRSAAGLVLLSMQTEAKVEKVLQVINARQDADEAPIELRKLMPRLAKIKKQGYAYNEGLTEGIGALALPLPRTVNGRFMALCVAGPISRIKPKHPAIAQLAMDLISKHLPEGVEGLEPQLLSIPVPPLLPS